jgi:hypothetical protein
VLSAVDAHTAHHLYEECLKGELLRGRTVILVSHHVQLCVPGSSYVVALDNGRVTYAGDSQTFRSSGAMDSLVQSDNPEAKELKTASAEMKDIELEKGLGSKEEESEASSTIATTEEDTKPVEKKKAPRKLIEEEKRAVGRISRDIWEAYILACGSGWYWLLFVVAMVLATASPVLENGWLKCVLHSVRREYSEYSLPLEYGLDLWKSTRQSTDLCFILACMPRSVHECTALFYVILTFACRSL